MNHCPNLNAPAITTGKVSAADLRARIDERDAADREALHERFARACTSNACRQGRTACPTPEACRWPADGSLVGFGLAACAVSAVAVLAVLVMVFA